MPRAARIVVPGVAHHVTQRGNRRLKTFFKAEDYVRYLELLAAACTRVDRALRQRRGYGEGLQDECVSGSSGELREARGEGEGSG